MNAASDTSSLVSIERLIEQEQLGIEVLHPGGLALTAEFARLCGIREGTKVLKSPRAREKLPAFSPPSSVRG